MTPKMQKARQEMHEITPYTKAGKRLSENAFWNRLVKLNEKAGYGYMNMLIWGTDTMQKWGYWTGKK
ncbi:hypothetical protein LU293_07360 [Moraxella nasovis]|uniref:hypothetical protein n=1 Tax=Moraxella nasovis TaxID=2904121 RepID=UPI001F623D79|nr:hypothetical protein [Moraxella nasovis]UNU72905.1 hypothetical protein LU293_07360 [Moraxella nasovis]